MKRRHPVIGSDAGICLTVLDQVLDDLQVTLLTGQVERRGTILGLRVDEAVGRKESWLNMVSKFLHNNTFAFHAGSSCH